jgi:sialate O-acetylesterase
MRMQDGFLRAMLAALASLAAMALRADVTLPPLFADHVVLQRDQPVRIWGWAAAGEAVTVTFAGSSAHASADASGRWLVTLPPQKVSATGRDLEIRGRTTHVLHDVLVGDVWLCSGQSNMELGVASSLDAKREIAAANLPTIREIKIGRRLAEQPVEDFKATAWRPATPAVVGAFTAAGYYFAREMVRQTGVPVGLVQCSWSGTSIEPWMSAGALHAQPEFAVVAQRWSADLAAYPERRKIYEEALLRWKNDEAAAKAQGDATQAAFLKDHRMPRPPAGAPDHPYPGNPSQLYNGMVYPLRHFTMRGVLWYQGEGNAVRAKEYSALFRTMIPDWRRTLGQADLPFYWVQIANFLVDTDWARLREAQASALTLPHTGQAVAIDIGDPLDIHPANKQEVGRRLALIALAQLDGHPEEFSGPLFAGATFGGGAARVNFTHAAGLHSRSGRVASVELAGGDRVFRAAEGRIEGEALIVTAPGVPEPVAVRYAWSAAPVANLYNLAGLPAAPFRSDDW